MTNPAETAFHCSLNWIKEDTGRDYFEILDAVKEQMPNLANKIESGLDKLFKLRQASNNVWDEESFSKYICALMDWSADVAIAGDKVKNG